MQPGEMHNGGGAGGWGKGNTTGNGFDPEGSSDITSDEKLISQMAALDNITTVRIELTINGVPQPAIIADATTTKDVLPRMTPEDKVSGTAYINLSDGTTRVAQLEETHPELGKALPFKVPYYYRCVNSSGTEIVPSTEYFSRNGIDLSGVADNTIGWLCETDGTMYNGNYISGVRGDITLSPVYAAPNCVITVTPPGTATETASGSGIYEITNLSNSFSLLVGLADGTSFPAGTSTSWQVNGTAITNGTTPETCSAAPDDVGITAATIGSNPTNASTMTINCLINIPGEPQAATTKTIKVYKKITLPTTFSIDVTAPGTASADSITADKYAVTAPADPFTFAASLSDGTTFPTGTVFNWTINAGGTSITKTGQSFTLAPSSGAALSTIYDSPTIWNIACAISHPDMANATAPSVSKPINLYQVNPPAMTVTKPSTATETATGIYKIVNMTDTFTFEATESDGSPLPTATTSFQWYVDGSQVADETSYIFNASPTTLGLSETTIGTNQTNATSVEVKCVVTRPNGDAPAVKTIKVFKPVTLPTSFDVTVTAPSTAGTTEPYVVYRNTDSFTFAAAPSSGGSFPTGTKFSWTITGGSATVTKTNLTTSSVNVAASEFGTISTTSATPTTLTATCTIDHADKLNTAQSDDTTAQVYKFTIPAFTITFTPAAGSYNTANSNTSAAVPVYAMTDTTSSFTIKAVPDAGTFPDGTKFSWTVNGFTMSGVSQHGDTLSLNFAGIGLSDLSTSSANPTSFSITCTAHDDHDPRLVTKNADAKTVKVYKLTIPDFEMGLIDPSGLSTDTDDSGNTVYLVTDADMSSTDAAKKFEFVLGPKTAGQSFPIGTTFTWSFDSTSTPHTEDTISTNASGFASATPTTLTSYNITCTATCDGITKVSDTFTVRLNRSFPATGLSAYLGTLTPNPTGPAYVLPAITGLTTSDWTSIVTTLRAHPDIYVDLHLTKLPEGITKIGGWSDPGFMSCTSLVVPPQLPDSLTNLGMGFESCSNLREAPVIPSNVTSLASTFWECTSLTDLSSMTIPASVTKMAVTFYHCTGLTTAPVIPANVTEINDCFHGCTSLTGTIIIKADITDPAMWKHTFKDIPASNNLIIKVRSNDVKQAILDSADYQNNVTIVVDSTIVP